ncbi:PfkB family carbohydrate kinase [Candidatus Omnitrophota bacterium]
MGITVVGSVAIDDVITPFGKNFNAPGGSATYFSLSASNFTKVKLVAVVGKDFPNKYIRLLDSKGIDTKGLEIKEGKTFRWKGRYDKTLDNPESLRTHLNLFGTFRPKLPKGYHNEKILFLANIDPDLQLDVLDKTNPKLIAADTINFWITHKRKSLLKVLKRIDILIINEYEARELTNESNIIKASKSIISMGPKVAIVKKGEDGLILVSKNGLYLLPAYPLETVLDPTGAGDTFAGGFLGYLSKVGRFNEKTFKQACLYGTIMASFTVEGYDISNLARLSKNKINQRAKQFKKICSL